jgi:hypothetical protein
MQLPGWIFAPFRREPRKPLAYRRPDLDAPERPPLGMEAIDMSVVQSAQRRNASLERVSTLFTSRRQFGSFMENADADVARFNDDETYAARYHRAYNQKKGS